MAGGVFSTAKVHGMTIRESATDGSDFTNPDADYRRLFLGEDGLLHVKDSAGTVSDPYSSSAATLHGCKVSRASTSFSVGNNTYTPVQWDAEVFDTDTMHDNSTNPTRVDIPTISGVTTGLWQLRCFGYTDVTTGRTDVMFRKNAAGNPASGTLIDALPGYSNATASGFLFTTLAVLADTDYVEAFVRTSGASGNVVYDAGAPPRFEVVFLVKVT